MSGPFNNEPRDLRDRLLHWTDPDVAMYHLGAVLGILPRRDDKETEAEHWFRCKSIFWTASSLSSLLCNALDALVVVGVLEREQDETGIAHGSCRIRFVQNVPTEHDPEPPVEIHPRKHYMALANGLFALRALQELPNDVESLLTGIHATFWDTLDENEQTQLEHDLEVAMHRWKHAFEKR